jgi:hypothetical protein
MSPPPCLIQASAATNASKAAQHIQGPCIGYKDTKMAAHLAHLAQRYTRQHQAFSLTWNLFMRCTSQHHLLQKP